MLIIYNRVGDHLSLSNVTLNKIDDAIRLLTYGDFDMLEITHKDFFCTLKQSESSYIVGIPSPDGVKHMTGEWIEYKELWKAIRFLSCYIYNKMSCEKVKVTFI